MRRHLIYIHPAYILFTAILLTSCSQGTSGEENERSENVILEQPERVHTLKDDQTPIGRLDEVYMLDDNRLLIVEGAPAIRIFEHYELAQTLGQAGPGPCEYESISAVYLRGDTLSVLSPQQTKIINYHVNTGNCLGEISSESLSSEYYLFRDAESYVTGNMAFTMATPDTVRMLQRVYPDGRVQPLDLPLSELNSIRTFVSMRAPALDFSRRGNELFAYFPLTEKIFALDLYNHSVRSFPLKIDIQREKFDAAGNDPNKVLEIIRGNFPFVRWVKATDDWIAVQYVRQAEDGTGNPDFTLQFYSPEGRFIGEVTTKYQVVGYHDGKFIEMRLEGLEGDYSYGLAFRGVTISSTSSNTGSL